MKQIKKVLIVVLIALGVTMLYIGIMNKIVPPALTGVGFGVIAFLFNADSK